MLSRIRDLAVNDQVLAGAVTEVGLFDANRARRPVADAFATCAHDNTLAVGKQLGVKHVHQ